MSDEARSKICLRLRQAREYLGISQEEASEASNISRSAISLIETGKRKLDTVELMELSKLYQRPMAYFTDDDFSVELDPEAAVFARSFSDLSKNDKEELTRFAEYLAMRSKK